MKWKKRLTLKVKIGKQKVFFFYTCIQKQIQFIAIEKQTNNATWLPSPLWQTEGEARVKEFEHLLHSNTRLGIENHTYAQQKRHMRTFRIWKKSGNELNPDRKKKTNPQMHENHSSLKNKHQRFQETTVKSSRISLGSICKLNKLSHGNVKRHEFLSSWNSPNNLFLNSKTTMTVWKSAWG